MQILRGSTNRRERSRRRELPAARLRFTVTLARFDETAEAALQAVQKLQQPKRALLGRLDEVAVLLISDRRMSELHWRFMREHGPTDVITFDHGEIFVSVQTAEENRRRFGTSLQRELELYVVHGLLHLNGFDDRKPADARKMERTQAKILSTLK